MVKRREPPSQGWKTFLRNHADGIAAMDMFVVPTISFRLLYGLLIMEHGRRQILRFGVTSHPCPCRKPNRADHRGKITQSFCPMREALSLIWTALVGLFRSPASLAAEIMVLRHQINILRRHSPKRQTFSAMARLIFAGLYRLAPTVLNALAIVKPETVIKWHRAGFRSYWH